MESNRVKDSQQKSKIPCDGCKQHHIKCDRALEGCKNCIRRGITCTYLIERKRRGPKTKLETMIKYVESLNCSVSSQTPSEGDSNGDIANNIEHVENVGDVEIAPEHVNCNELENPIYRQTTQVEDNSLIYQAPIDLQAVNYQNFYNPLLDPRFINFGFNSTTTATNLPDVDPAFEMTIYSGQLNENRVNLINSGANYQDQNQNQNHNNSQHLDQNNYKMNFH